MGNVLSYRDLEVWKRSRALAGTIYAVTQPFPKEETYGLTSQIRRAAVSIPSNIAEGHSRSSTKDYIHFVSIAIGSVAELETQLLIAEDLHYLQPAGAQHSLREIAELQKMLFALRNRLKTKL